ncbi:hypothetical protein EX30DRAFT_393897 [Ascodesmis nigricans]|uniref:Protein phosphatase n=1 Tax=Ascodesmis nigricans TaxID=341454 RepID=A0A4S2N5N9_9PEZI|nr:hypothetical protein EX30DRAFT_393897 [Ascodesmis nigricans]
MPIHVPPLPRPPFRPLRPPLLHHLSARTLATTRPLPAPSPFAFIASHSQFAKRPARPFPPPFNTPALSSFTDPLSAFKFSRPGYTRPQKERTEGASFLSGLTNGDDAVLATSTHLGVADGVGAWNTKAHGHAALWSRLMLHYWSNEMLSGEWGFKRKCGDGNGGRIAGSGSGSSGSSSNSSAAEETISETPSESPPPPPTPTCGVDPILCLQSAYEKVLSATSKKAFHPTLTTSSLSSSSSGSDATLDDPADEEYYSAGWKGTTTICTAVLKGPHLLLTNLGDSVGFVYRPPSPSTFLLRTREQWHWFDCPRQLGTNSPDTPTKDAVLESVDIQDGDIVILASDGLVDNIWDEEILAIIRDVLAVPEAEVRETIGEGGDRGRMALLADRLVEAARVVAVDPCAESPYMERSIEEGVGIEGGKFDDISVVTAVCRLRGEKRGEMRGRVERGWTAEEVERGG